MQEKTCHNIENIGSKLSKKSDIHLEIVLKTIMLETLWTKLNKSMLMMVIWEKRHTYGQKRTMHDDMVTAFWQILVKINVLAMNKSIEILDFW